jgi:hypothetical protein
MNILFVLNLDPTICYAWYTYSIYMKPRIKVIYILLNLIIKINLNDLGILKNATIFVIEYTYGRGVAFTNLKRVNNFLRSVDVN